MTIDITPEIMNRLDCYIGTIEINNDPNELVIRIPFGCGGKETVEDIYNSLFEL